MPPRRVLPAEGEGPCCPPRALWLGLLRPNHRAEGRGTRPLLAGGQRASSQEEELTSSQHPRSPSLGLTARQTEGRRPPRKGKAAPSTAGPNGLLSQFSVRPETPRAAKTTPAPAGSNPPRPQGGRCLGQYQHLLGVRINNSALPEEHCAASSTT